jgi:DNA polymerase-3 subunit epsilon
MADTEATLKVLIEQVKKYEEQTVVDTLGNVIGSVKNDVKTLHNLTNTKTIDLASRMIYNEQQVPVFNFGKHKGRSVTEVLKVEPTYYNWMLQGDFSLDTKRKLTQIKMGLFH